MVTDVCVPISRLSECLIDTRRDIEDGGLIAPIVGHVGDGNFHLLVLIKPNSSEEVDNAKAFHHRLVDRAITMQGTCTGEHGSVSEKFFFLSEN